MGADDMEDTVKAEDKSSSLAMTQEEILAQVSICGSFVFTNLPDDDGLSF